MGITSNDFLLIVRALRTIWPDMFREENEKNLWYNLLHDIDYPTLNRATKIYMQQNRFAPKPADLRMIAADLQNGPQEGAALAWENVLKALSRADPNEEFAKLPDIVQRVIGGPGTLRAWSRTDTTSLQSVQRPLFIKEYERIRNDERKQVALQPNLRREELPIYSAKTPQIADTVRQAGEKIPMPPELMEKLRRRLSGIDP